MAGTAGRVVGDSCYRKADRAGMVVGGSCCCRRTAGRVAGKVV